MTAAQFIKESNKIENIKRPATGLEIKEYHRFMALDEVTVEDCIQFVKIYQPEAVIRDQRGLDVFIGNHVPPFGSEYIPMRLEGILKNAHIHTPFENHVLFEDLHPFTDSNGRLGRMLWMRQMKYAPLGFLHTFYYQTLSATRPTR